MRNIFYIGDFILQSLLVIANTIFLTMCHNLKDLLGYITVSWIVIGGGQMLSSVLHVLFIDKNSPYVYWRVLHLVGAPTYAFIAIILPVSALSLHLSEGAKDYIFYGGLCIIPQIIFYAYYILCLVETVNPYKEDA